MANEKTVKKNENIMFNKIFSDNHKLYAKWRSVTNTETEINIE